MGIETIYSISRKLQVVQCNVSLLRQTVCLGFITNNTYIGDYIAIIQVIRNTAANMVSMFGVTEQLSQVGNKCPPRYLMHKPETSTPVAASTSKIWTNKKGRDNITQAAGTNEQRNQKALC